MKGPDVFDVPPVQSYPLDVILASAGPLLGNPIEPAPPGPDYCHSISPEKLAQLRSFSDCGHKVTEAAIDIARFLAVVPTGSGGIQIEWHAHGWDVEVEVNAAGEFDSVFVTRAEVKK